MKSLVISNLPIPSLGNLDVFTPRLLRLFLKGVQNIDCISKLRNVQNSPFAQDMNSNLSYSGSNIIHRLRVGRLQSSLDRVKFKSGLPPSLGWEISKIIKTRTNEQYGFHPRDYTSKAVRMKQNRAGKPASNASDG